MEMKKEERTEIEGMIHYIRNTAMFRQLVPMEAVSGWPVPIKKNGRIYIKFPFYGAENKGKGNTILYPPMALVTMDYQTKKIVEYINTRYSNPSMDLKWNEPVGKFPHDSIKGMSVLEYKSSKKSLMGLYDKLINNLTEGSSMDEEEDRRFGELLSLLIEPELKPYYVSISPKFFGHFLK